MIGARRVSGWPVERALCGLAGSAVLLAAVVSPWFLVLTAFVGVNAWVFVALGAWPASLLLGRILGLSSSSCALDAFGGNPR